MILFKLPSIVKQIDKTACSQGSFSFDSKSNQVKWDIGKVTLQMLSTGIPLLSAELVLDA